MKLQLAVLSICLLGAYSASAKDVNLSVGQSKDINYIGKLYVSCVGEQATSANKKISSANVVTRGGALDSEDKAFMVQGEFMKNFSPLPTKITAVCLADEATRSDRVNGQEDNNNRDDYNDYRTLNNKYWECTPGGLTGYTSQRNFSGKSCNRDEAFKAADFKCYQNDRFRQNECSSPITCYIVKMDPSLMCDYIYPSDNGNNRPNYPR